MPKNYVGSKHIGKFYEVTDIILGQGSFSKVYLARHSLFGNKVALKVIDRNKIEEEYVSKNLTREASILRKLKHPNIVNFYEEFSHDQLYCLSMELVDGCDLSNFLNMQKSRKVSEEFAKTLFFQMVSAINYMHKAHILHRDLKQENILLEYGRVIKIVDFGLSNIYYPYTRLRTHCGSLEYAAPELFVNISIYGAGVDLWSLGVILYSMVVGRMPFVVPKKSDGPHSLCHKDKFHRRISRGLTQENWENMRDLSYDCCHLLKNLLQPNQYKRLQIRNVYVHPWLQKNSNLKKSLPQHRHDLQRRYKQEIIDWMAEKLCVPNTRVQNHLATYRFDSISAIYYIMQDTLVKEVLYPPENITNSFIFRLNNRRRTTGYGTYEHHDYVPPRAGLCEAPVSRGFEANPPAHTLATKKGRGTNRQWSQFQPQKVDRGLLNKPRERDARNVTEIRNRVGDGDHLGRTYSEKSSVVKLNPAFSKHKGNLVLKKEDLKCVQPVEDQSSTFASKPFRSYKHNRPAKAKIVSGDVAVEASNGQFKVCEGKRNLPIDTNENSDQLSKSSINLNFQRNLDLLNERYALKSKLLSKSKKLDNKAEVQLNRNWKRKPLNGKYEPNDTSITSNGIKDHRTSMNTNGRGNSTNENYLIYNSELDSKDKMNTKSLNHQMNKFTARSKAKEHNGASKITEQIPAGKNCLKHFSSSQNQQHKKRFDNLNRTVDAANACYPDNKGRYNVRRNPLHTARADASIY